MNQKESNLSFDFYNLDPEGVKKVVESIKKGEDLMGYLNEVSYATLQEALEKGLKSLIKEGANILKSYFNLASNKTLNKVISDEDLLEKGFENKLKIGNSFSTFNLIIGSHVILKKIKSNQSLVKENIKKRLANGESVMSSVAIASFETLKDFKKELDEKFLGEVIGNLMDKNKKVPQELFFLSDYQTFQKALFDNILNRLKNGQEISDHFVNLLSKEKFNAFRGIQPQINYSIKENYFKKGKIFPSRFLKIIATHDLLVDRELMQSWASSIVDKRLNIKAEFLPFIEESFLKKIIKNKVYECIDNNLDFPIEYYNFIDDLKLFREKGSLMEGRVLGWLNSGKEIPENYSVLIFKYGDYFIQKVKDNYQYIVINGIKNSLFNKFFIPQSYFKFVTEESLEKISNDEEFINAVLERYILVDDIAFPKDLFSLVKPEILEKIKKDKKKQEIIKDNIKKFLKYSEYIAEEYINLASEETLNEIKKEKELIKEGLKAVLIRQLKVDVHHYRALLSSDDFQQALKEGFKNCILNNLDIPLQFIYLMSDENLAEIKKDPVLQNEIKEIIKKEFLVPKSISSGYFYLIGENLEKEIKTDKNLQLIIQETIKKAVFNNLDISDYCVYFASDIVIENLKQDEEFQTKLKEKIVTNLNRGRDIDFNYFNVLAQKTIDEMMNDRSIKELFKRRIIKRAIKGFSFYNYFNILPADFKVDVFEIEELKKIVKESILQAFSFATINEQQEINHFVDSVLKKKDKNFLMKALLDRTFVPVGLKIHDEEKSSDFNNYLNKSGGFIAYKAKETFVVPPFSNPYILDIFLTTIKLFLERKSRTFGKNMYLQATFPQRLNNELCGILTLSFLLSSKNILLYNRDLIKHNQSAIGLTIYDAGGFISKEHTFFKKGKKPFIGEINGRTDLLFCTEPEDLRRSLTVYTLLFASLNKDNFYYDLGSKFIEEFKDILKNNNREDWLNNKFVGLSQFNQEEIDKLGELLIEITQIRLEIKDKASKGELEADNLRDKITSLIEKYYMLLMSNSLQEVNID